MTQSADIVAECREWTDAFLLSQYHLGRAAYAVPAVFEALQAEVSRRGLDAAPGAPPPPTDPMHDPNLAGLRGVRGWLLLFAVLCFVGGGYAVGVLVYWSRVSPRTWQALESRVPGFGATTYLALAAMVAVAAAQVAVGILVIRRRPSAALLAVASLVAAVALMLLTSLVSAPVLRELALRRGSSWPSLLQLCTGAAVQLSWLAYFFRSRRVRATFGPVTWDRVRLALLGRLPSEASHANRAA